MAATFSPSPDTPATVADDGNDRISPDGYSVTDDEKRYLRRLCAGPKDAHEIAEALAADASVSKPHPPATVADRLAYLVDYGGTELLDECAGEWDTLTDDRKAVFR